MSDLSNRLTPEQVRDDDLSKYTVVDLRERDEYIISTLKDAVNIPFSEIGSKIYTIPKDKPVLVFCREGDWSTEVVELLNDAEYTAFDIEGGYAAYRRLTENAGDASSIDTAPVIQTKPVSKEPIKLDAMNLKCPGPIVKTADKIRSLHDGDTVLVTANELAFASDIKVWCERTGNNLLKLDINDGIITALIEKSSKKETVTANTANNDKTIVVFSGDLDKAIATFIIANGAAAMGRKVTVFFTFWGLNILRRPKRQSVKKGFIERCMGAMMPRGTFKLGLSRMNMGGIGAKMIRYVMKSKNVSSLEDLIKQAREHGVRIVACQMSMDIMGIKQEELIDGVELGGVATFLGAGETSDMSLFI